MNPETYNRQPPQSSVVIHGIRFCSNCAYWSDWLEYGAWTCDLDQNVRVALYSPTCPIDGQAIDELLEVKLRAYFMDELREAGLDAA